MKSRFKRRGSICGCNCGGYAKPGNRFIYGHHRRGKRYPDQSERMRLNNPMKNLETVAKISGKNSYLYGKIGEYRPGYKGDKYAEVKAKKAPFCQCINQCGQKTKWCSSRNKYNKYINGHQNIGCKHSKESRNAQSKKWIENNPMHNLDVIIKRSGDNHHMKKIEQRQRQSEWMKENSPMKRSEIAAKISGKNHYSYGMANKDHPNFGRKRPDASKYMLNGGAAHALSFAKNPSKPQVELYNLVKLFYPNAVLNHLSLNRLIDIAIPKEFIAIEYDCWYWHDEEKDKIRQKELENIGWKFLRYKDYIPNIDELEDDLRKMSIY